MNSNHKFSLNSTVLCFEPDISKAKLIYFCRIMEHCNRPSKNKQDCLPEYFVHFFGWKRKFDRRVSEELILENTTFNRTLKRKIDEVAYNVKDLEDRKRRIDSILLGAATCCDEVDWNEIPGVWIPSENNKPKIILPIDQNILFSPDSELDSSPEISSPRVKFSLNNIDYMEFENDESHYTFIPRLSISKRLVNIIKEHIHCSRKICDTFSIQFLLQVYYDGFPYRDIKLPPWGQFSSYRDRIQLYNMMIIERNAKSMMGTYEERDYSRIICAETLHGLKVLLDELFYDYILTKNELNFENTVKTPVYSMQDMAKSYNLFSLKPSMKLFDNDEEVFTRPSTNYGPRYLLRLLVRFPELMNRSSLTLCKKALVMRQVQFFINYLDETSLFWFSSAEDLIKKRVNFPLDSIVNKISETIGEKNDKFLNYFKAEGSCIETSSISILPQITVETSSLTTEENMQDDVLFEIINPGILPSQRRTDASPDPEISSIDKPIKSRRSSMQLELSRLKMNLVNTTPRSRRRRTRSTRSDSEQKKSSKKI